MKVYVVRDSWLGEQGDILKVFSTKEKAMEYMKKEANTDKNIQVFDDCIIAGSWQIYFDECIVDA